MAVHDIDTNGTPEKFVKNQEAAYMKDKSLLGALKRAGENPNIENPKINEVVDKLVEEVNEAADNAEET